MKTCRSCHAEVIFVPSAKTGKPMILDAKPSRRIRLVLLGQEIPLGEFLCLSTATQRIVVAEVSADALVDHHVTCPNAADWKGRRRGREEAHDG